MRDRKAVLAAYLASPGARIMSASDPLPTSAQNRAGAAEPQQGDEALDWGPVVLRLAKVVHRQIGVVKSVRAELAEQKRQYEDRIARLERFADESARVDRAVARLRESREAHS